VLAYTICGLYTFRYLQLAQAVAKWLLGRNRFGVQLYDLATGACVDDLEPQGLSLNQGAESVICVLLTLLVIAEKHDNMIEEQSREAVSLAATGRTLYQRV
jgi:hypothetical protein